MNKIIKKQMLIYDNIHGYIEISLSKTNYRYNRISKITQLHQTGVLYLAFLLRFIADLNIQ